MTDTYHCCCFCGRECGSAEPATFRCCGEIGHTEERDAETDEVIEPTHDGFAGLNAWADKRMAERAAKRERLNKKGA